MPPEFIVVIPFALIMVAWLLAHLDRDKNASGVVINYTDIYEIEYLNSELSAPLVKKEYDALFDAMTSNKTIIYKGVTCVIAGERAEAKSRVFRLRRAN